GGEGGGGEGETGGPGEDVAAGRVVGHGGTPGRGGGRLPAIIPSRPRKSWPASGAVVSAAAGTVRAGNPGSPPAAPPDAPPHVPSPRQTGRPALAAPAGRVGRAAGRAVV